VEDSEQQTLQEAVDRFAALAREYCAWAEGPPLTDEEDLNRAIAFVARLYCAALQLPSTNPRIEDASDGLSLEDYRAIHKRFSSLPFQYYWEVFHPVADAADEAVAGDICDDLADIYRDLKDGLAIFDAGNDQLAGFHWSSSFGFHWGRHATSALHALHCYATRS